MRLGKREELRELDQRVPKEFGVSEDNLMESAGAEMVKRILEIPGIGTETRVGIFCGPGNNGGDGLVVARKLLQIGFAQIQVWKLPSQKYSPLFETNLRRLKEIGGDVHTLNLNRALSFEFKKYDLLIDAILGTGVDRPLDIPLVNFIKKMNQQKISIISLDVPTGLDANRGIQWGAAVHATWTLTCALSKPGFYIQEGPLCCGKIQVLDIGFPKKAVKKIANSTFLIGKKSAKELLPRRSPVANKTKFGKLLIIAGSSNMKGAAGLAAHAAARMGAGYVVVASPFAKTLNQMPPDFMQVKWEDILKVDLSKYSAIAIGPGLGTGKETLDVIKRLLKEKIQNVVVDADAISVCAQYKLWPLPSSWVLTPHAGEMSRILGIKSELIESDRLASAEKAARLTGATILLKGFRTVIHSNKKSYIINSGNVALAKAGSGDVLTGFISSLMAQGLNVDRAAALGAYLHGSVADMWIKKGGSPLTLMASDIPDLLNSSLKTLQKASK
jgi:NAD(P)H-hydrate epimerase